MSSTSPKDILTAYRHLYRHGLRAVHYSAPARYTLRDRLRRSFRRGDRTQFDQEKVDRTLLFLTGAALNNGLEHKIVRGLLLTWFYEGSVASKLTKLLVRDAKNAGQNADDEERPPHFAQFPTNSYDSFNHTIKMLNESMRLCLPCGD